MTEAPVVWETPPKQHRTARQPKWAPLLEPFKENPGVWGRLDVSMSKTLAYSLATRINTGKLAGINKGDFRAISRKHKEDNQYYVWVCFQPEEDSQGPPPEDD